MNRVEFVPAKLKVKQIIQQLVECTECGIKASENPKDHFRKVAIPESVLSHFIANPSLTARTIADLESEIDIKTAHIAEALQFRQQILRK